jgi:hypothetical protein
VAAGLAAVAVRGMSLSCKESDASRLDELIKGRALARTGFPPLSGRGMRVTHAVSNPSTSRDAVHHQHVYFAPFIGQRQPKLLAKGCGE